VALDLDLPIVVSLIKVSAVYHGVPCTQNMIASVL
jgi:hypothetical protein